MDNHPANWYSKLALAPSDLVPSEARVDAGHELLTRHELLNQVDWRDYIFAVLTGAESAFESLQPEDEQDLLLWIAQVFNQLSPVTRQLADRGLESCLRPALKRSERTDGRRLLRDGIRLAGLVEGCLAPTLLEEIALAGRHTQSLRMAAADALWQSGAQVNLARWKGVDPTEEPFLTPAIVGLLSLQHPEEALRTLARVPDSPASLDPFLYSVSFAIRALAATRQGTETLGEIYANSPAWLNNFMERLLTEEDEFTEQDLLERIAGSLGPRRSQTRGGWEWLLHHASEKGYLPYREVRYGFEEGEESDFLQTMRNEFFRAVSEDLNRVEIPSQPLEYSLNTLVDDMLTGRVPVLEPGYGSRKRLLDAELVRIGWLDTLGLVASPSHICSLRVRWERDAGTDPDRRPAKTLNDAIGYALNETAVQCITQDSSSLADEVITFLEEQHPGVAARWEMTGRSVGDLDLVAELIHGNDKRIALLDWWSAVQVGKALGDLESAVLRLRYSPRIPVGFFFPRGDRRYREALEAAITIALRPGDRWHPRFRMIMEDRCLIRLDPDDADRQRTAGGRESPASSEAA